MTAQFPVHPDDVKQLLKIRRYLIGFRKTNGWSQPVLSRKISGTDGMVWDLESNQTWQWRLSRLQDWCTPFDLRLDARLRFTGDEHHAIQLEDQVHGHPEVAPMYALSQVGDAWKKWQGLYLTSSLRVARIILGISSEEMGLRLRVTRKAICNWENAASELMLAKVLEYARALGGFVQLELVEQDEQ